MKPVLWFALGAVAAALLFGFRAFLSPRRLRSLSRNMPREWRRRRDVRNNANALLWQVRVLCNEDADDSPLVPSVMGGAWLNFRDLPRALRSRVSRALYAYYVKSPQIVGRDGIWLNATADDKAGE